MLAGDISAGHQPNSAFESDTVESGGDVIDLRSLWIIARRRLPIFLVVAVLIAAFPIAYAFMAKDQYTASANVLIDRRTLDVSDAEAVLSGLPQDSASVDTEVRILHSPNLVRRVVTKLDLVKDPEFNDDLGGGGLLSSIRGLWSGISDKALSETRSPEQKVIANVMKGISVERQGLTYVIAVSATTNDPNKSARIANTLAGEYLNSQVQEKVTAAEEAQKFLNSRLSGLGSEVQNKESAAETLRARAGIPDAANIGTYDQQAIQDLSRQSIALQSDLAEKRGKLAAARAARANPGALPDVIASNVVRDLKAQRASAIASAADIDGRYGPLHPESIKIHNQIREIDAEIAREVTNITSSLNQEVAVAEQRLGVIQSQLASQRGSAVNNSLNAARVAQIEREATASREVYEDFLKRSKEAAQTTGLAKADASIVNSATPPQKPSGPQRGLIVAAGLGLAGALGALAIVVAELIDAKLSSGTDVRKYLGLKKLASIPEIKLGSTDESRALMIVDKPMSSYTEAFRGLVDHVGSHYASSTEGNAQLIMIASAIPHEGKTTVACSLALSLAAMDQKTLLIDADLRRPQVLPSLRIDPTEANGSAIAALLEGKTSARADAMSQIAKSTLDVLPLALGSPSMEIFRNGAFLKMLSALKPYYDVIVIDTPPVLALNDARHVANRMDQVLFVSRWRQTTRFAARTAVQALRDVEAPLTGAILNGVNIRKQPLYGRDDSLAFYGSYKMYYNED